MVLEVTNGNVHKPINTPLTKEISRTVFAMEKVNGNPAEMTKLNM